MKMTVIAGVTAVSLMAASSMSVAQAGQGEWATAGKVLTGVFAAGVLARALEPAPTTAVVYQTPPPVVYQPAPVYQPVYQPAPQVVYQAPPQVVYQAPPPVVYYSAPAPVYYPAPVVVVRSGCYPVYHHPYRRW
ncbi:MAG TPA: hypothetical protein VMF06_20670 [Candidatus Limnocylindria bacterium]|jgi:hypothetical protein|nr:hypothetical protein [Candidatus Limnocylindria bacterium]